MGSTTLTFNSSFINDYIVYNRAVTQIGGTSVDLFSMNLLQRLFTYMFRPFFIDANGIFGIISSIDNLILLSIFTYPFLKLFFSFKIKKLEFKPKNIFILIYTSLLWYFLSASTSNLGLALRHKLMFLPAFIILMLDLATNSNKKSILKKIN